MIKQDDSIYYNVKLSCRAESAGTHPVPRLLESYVGRRINQTATSSDVIREQQSLEAAQFLPQGIHR